MDFGYLNVKYDDQFFSSVFILLGFWCITSLLQF